jgi:hypothetical protein
MAYSTTPLPGRGLRRWGAVLFWVGLVLTLVSLVATVASGFSLARNAEGLEDARAIVGSTTVTLQAGEVRGIVKESTQDPDPSCAVTGPDGAEVPVRGAGELSSQWGLLSFIVVADFEATASGDHTVSCEGSAATLIPPVGVDGLLGGAFVIVAGVLGMGFGVTLALIGLVLWIVGRSQSSKAMQGPTGYQGYPPPGYPPR